MSYVAKTYIQHNGLNYKPGDKLSDDLTEKQAADLLVADAVEKVDEKPPAKAAAAGAGISTITQKPPEKPA